MCRFLIIKFKQPRQAGEIFEAFAEACRESRTPDGDRQEDGWGICFLDKNGFWAQRKSIHPIWEELEVLQEIPSSSIFLIHVRSSSFKTQKWNIEFNQPFVGGNSAFVFNGFLQGVNFKGLVEGKIGSQKIWHLLRRYLVVMDPRKALSSLLQECLTRAKSISALNLGFCAGLNLYAMCYYEKNPEYYSLHFWQTAEFSCICSEPFLPSVNRTLKAGEIIMF